ncbi:MAG: type II secretion system protein [Phycisphaerales bacterium]
MGCIERQRGVRRANRHRRQRCAAPIVHHPLSVINSPGFTLIELLVVIAVIAVLMAVLLPVLGAARKRAKALICRSHLKEWGTTLGLYLEENEGRFPRSGSNDVDSTLSLLRGLNVGDKIDPNAPGRFHGVRTEGIALCPMATTDNGPVTFTGRAAGEIYVEGKLGLVFAPWEITRPAPSFRMSYGLNNHVFSHSFEGFSGVLKLHQIQYTDVFSLRRRVGIPLLLDAVQPFASLGLEGQRPPSDEPSGSEGEICINRHDGTLNSLFLDWSVRPVGLKELWTLKWHLQWDTAGPWTKAGGVQPEDWPKWMRRFKDY